MARQVQLLLNLARKPSTSSPPTLLFPTFDPLPHRGHSAKRRILPPYDPAPPRPENSTECRRTLPASDPAPPRPENSTECRRTLPASDPAPPRPENSTECRRTLPASDPRPSPLVVLDPKSFGEAISDKILTQMKQWRKEDKDSARVNTTIAFVGFFSVLYQLWKDYSAWIEKKKEDSPILKQQSEKFKKAETQKRALR
ncbi:unnamed protein product [Linum trigynum]|uniref:Uncharacterized protein n=1 Tax=Linum trigynum TaxID=586398 RepID=A0AAV2G837_9ROSI